MDTRKPDIFDRLMHLSVLNIFESFYKKHKEMLLYLFFGGLTFVISVITYAFFNVSLGMNELVANIFSWILAVLFAFFTNRIWVFDGKTNGAKEFFVQMMNFFGGRVATLVVEEVILFVFITKLGFGSMVVKIAAQIIVIVLNYVISKLWVFRK